MPPLPAAVAALCLSGAECRLMAIRIRVKAGSLDAIDETKATLRQVIGAAILDMDTDLRNASPVDTGYFVNSWSAQANGSPAAAEGFAGPGRGASDAATIFAGVGGTVSLVNTAVYAGRLADGYSPQAPAGWVEAIANQLDDYIARHAMLSAGAR